MATIAWQASSQRIYGLSVRVRRLPEKQLSSRGFVFGLRCGAGVEPGNYWGIWKARVMTHSTGALRKSRHSDRFSLPQGISYWAIFGAVVLGFGFGTVAASVIGLSLTTKPDTPEKTEVPPKTVVLANPYGALAGAAYSFGSAPLSSDAGSVPELTADAKSSPPRASAPAPANLAPPEPKDVPDIVVIAHEAAPVPASSVPSEPKSTPEPVRIAHEPAKSAPELPSHPSPLRSQAKHRPHHSSASQVAAQITTSTPASATPDNRSFFQKLFDIPQQPPSSMLAYARTEDGSISSAPAESTSSALQSYDRYTAVYDLQAHTVYLPDGEKLEAHSGFGKLLDDPHYVNEKDRGATPPHVYDLVLRKPLFHGVQALRLTPVGSGNMYGRTGILAHTYMLGPNGQSNGCVSFKDYSKFLQAFLKGQVKRLVVVPHLS